MFDRAYQFFGEDYMDEEFYIAFSKFEERHKEVHFSVIQHELFFFC